MKYDTRFPSIADLKTRAKKRIPNFAFDYVDGGIDDEHGKRRNREAWHEVEIVPRYLTDVTSADKTTRIFNHDYALPIGIPPIGLGNMMWPGAEMALAGAAQKNNIPYILSTFSTTPLEEIAKAAPDVCWFQLYVPQQVEVMKDLLGRVKNAGFNALVVTLDIPVGAKRNRELKNGLKLPFSFTPNIVWQSMIHPTWAMQTLAHGQPDFVNVLQYKEGPNEGLATFITNFAMHGVTRERIEMIRDMWDGPLILKGVQYDQDFRDALDIGVDGVVVSNHGGRQLDAAPASADSLRNVAVEIGARMTVMVDSGIRTGMDVIRARALGAEMTFSGRSFFWGMGAMGTGGAEQVIEIYRDEIDRTLKQVGCGSYAEMDRSWLK
ncbi:MAG: alpha-hydroxy-acid oxidizing protein [Acidiferrobacterales bacterium]|nr:alpha-hydroxy-acid oxidizing protein [Acidiferrobacterales bacterium]